MKRKKPNFVLIASAAVILAVACAGTALIMMSGPRELIVPIDRSVLDKAPLLKRQAAQITKEPRVMPNEIALRPVPDPRLIEQKPFGRLPKIADNGDRAAVLYARPFDSTLMTSPLPKLAIIVLNAGMSESTTTEAFIVLPPDVSFALTPYANDADRQIHDIRAHGHEVFLHVQSKASVAAKEDRGPLALDPAKSDQDNHDKLLVMMGRMAGYAGLVGDFAEIAGARDNLPSLLAMEAKARGVSHILIRRPDSDTPKPASRDQAMTGASHRFVFLPGTTLADLRAALDAMLIDIKSAKSHIVFIEAGSQAADIVKDWIVKHRSHEFDLIPASALLESVGPN